MVSIISLWLVIHSRQDEHIFYAGNLQKFDLGKASKCKGMNKRQIKIVLSISVCDSK